jgi:nucleoside-diphosphate-sugar epimerase
MRVVVIGGTGHIGTSLVPWLAGEGHRVVSVSRGRREPYTPHPAWADVEPIVLDRTAAEADGMFGEQIARLGGEVVIDLTCFTLESAEQLAQALRGRVRHFLHCGTIWVHGASICVPTAETGPRRPIGEYGKRKAAIEAYLLEQARTARFPATIIHPGHLVGRGWVPITPAGNFDVTVFANLAAGREVVLPNFGMETLHHVHADDVAQEFGRAVANPAAAIGESFHAVSPGALTLRGYAESMARWFGKEPILRFAPYEEWRAGVAGMDATITFNHLEHSSHCSIDKSRTLLGYRPRYGSLEAVQEAIAWLRDHGAAGLAC